MAFFTNVGTVRRLLCEQYAAKQGRQPTPHRGRGNRAEPIQESFHRRALPQLVGASATVILISTQIILPVRARSLLCSIEHHSRPFSNIACLFSVTSFVSVYWPVAIYTKKDVSNIMIGINSKCQNKVSSASLASCPGRKNKSCEIINSK